MSKYPPLPIFLLVAACGAGPEKLPDASNPASSADGSAVAAEPIDPSAAAAMAAIRAEPKVRDLVYEPTGAVEWQVGVVDDGTPRHGFAEYLCIVIREAGAMTERTSVRVVDISAVSKGESFRAASLGRVECSTGAIVDP